MIHQTETQLRQLVIGAWLFSKYTGLHISLALPGPQEDIPTAAFFDHPFGDIVVLVLTAVLSLSLIHI